MQCTAKSKRTGEQCRANALKGKDVCRMHQGRPITHGLRSKYKGARMGDDISKYADDPDLVNIKLQIASLIAHQQRLLGQYEIAGHWGMGGFDAFTRVTAEIIKAIAVYQKVTEGSRYTIRIEHIQVVINQMMKVADETISNPDDRQRFLDRIGTLSLPSPAGNN